MKHQSLLHFSSNSETKQHRVNAGVSASLILLILGALAWNSAVFGADRRNQTRATTAATKNDGIDWQPSLSSALAVSKTSGKPVMVDFGATWCGACHFMDEQIFPDPKIVAASKGFVMLKVDIDQQPDIAAHYGIVSPPVIVWLRADGKAIVGIAGSLEVEQLLAAMREAKRRAQSENQKTENTP